jgi:hypothetical protein
MARQYAPLHTEIWNDPTFTGLTSQAQRLYLLAISQPNITWCGVVPYTARRWSGLADDTNPRVITKAAAELVSAGLVILDESTEEMWVRSFIKYNVLAQPKLRNAARREFGSVHSAKIREHTARAHPWIVTENGHPDGQGNGHPDAHSQESPDLRVGVGVQCQVKKENPSTENTNTNTNTELDAWLRSEAERQADAWAVKDPGSIVDRERWIAKRVRTLAKEHTEIPKRHLRLLCSNPDCRSGHDYSGDEPVPCASCNQPQEVSA